MGVKQTAVPAAAEEQALSDETLDVLKEKELEEEVPLEKTNTRLYLSGIIFSLIIVAAAGFLLYAKLNYFKDEPKKVVEVFEAEPASPAPAPLGLPKSAISLEVLNASGITGEARKVGDRLEALGYKVVKVGNADRQAENQVFLARDLEEMLGELLADLDKELGISSPSGYLEDSTASARVVLGD